MSDYADNYMTDENLNVYWVKMDYVGPIMKKTELAMDKLEADNKVLTAKLEELELTVSMNRSTINDKNSIIEIMRDGFQDLFSNRGEDFLTASICNKLIELSRN